jgi:outer membrane protein
MMRTLKMRGALVRTLFSLALALPAVAHADLIARALDGAQPGGGGGTGSAAVSTPSGAETDPNDLMTWAGEPKAITLPELLQIAIRQSPTLQNAKLDIAVAEAQISETWVRHDWTIGAVASYSHTGDTVFSGIEIGASTSYGLTADLTRILPTGATVDIHGSTQYSNTSFSNFASTPYWSDALTGSITQPLLKGYGTDLYNAQERKADLSRDAAVLARRLAALQTIQAVVSDYWDLVLAERQVAIMESSLAVAKERLHVTQVQVDSGRSAQSELPAVQQNIATQRESELTGELAILDASLTLRRAVGMEIGAGEFGLRVATDLDARDVQLDLGKLVERTFQASPQLAQLAKQDSSAGIDIAVNDNGLLPQLDLALTVGPDGVDSTFRDAARDVAEFKSYQVGGTLTFSRSLHQYDVRGRSTELRDTRQKIRVNAVDVKAQLAQAIAHAVAAIELAKRRIVLDREAVGLAKENIRIETDRFNVGRSTNFDVMLRLDEERQAELREVQAQIDWHKAETMMLMLTGDLLPTYGISVE